MMKRSAKGWIAGGVAAVVVAALATGGGMAAGYLRRADDYVKRTKEENYSYLSKTALKGQTVLVGDSITEYYSSGDLFVPYTKRTGTLVYNRGISGEVSARTLARLRDNVLVMQPKNMVLLIGVNDLGEGVPPERIVSNIREMLRMTKKESPGTNIILEAVFPVHENRRELAARIMVGSRKNSQVAQLNAMLKALAGQEGVTFLDLTEQLRDTDGNFRLEYCYDGLHPNATGYAVITEPREPLLK